jgi:aspartate-semialdehyde dehydrogenase
MAGQQFVEALDGHPWFQIVSLLGEKKEAGMTYRQARRGFSAVKTSPEIMDLKIKLLDDFDINSVDVVFSAIPSEVAEELEAKIAAKKPVISTASAYRYHDDVPIYLPIVNGEHYKMIDLQRKNRGWKGYVMPGPNCTTVGLTVAMYPIWKKFGIKSIHMVSMQAISGAGYPGVPAYDIVANVIPYIPHEEEKVCKEMKKIIGTFKDGKIISPEFKIDAKCNRVQVISGHMESIFFETEKKTTVEEIKAALVNFEGATAGMDLPNAPKHPICVFDDPFRPQPRIDMADKANGMITFVGGISASNYENGFKMTALSNNTELGAGRGGVLGAEYLLKKGYL